MGEKHKRLIPCFDCCEFGADYKCSDSTQFNRECTKRRHEENESLLCSALCTVPSADRQGKFSALI